jgi:hypothetical protein
MDAIMTGQILLHQMPGRNITPANTYYVSPSFNDNPSIGQFSTIQGAIDYAKANMPAYPDEVAIMVHPGTYEEQITDTHYRIFITGLVDTSYHTKIAILYNSGIDAAHYPIAYTGSQKLNLVNLTVLCDAGKTWGELPSLRADNCSFRDGCFTEYSGAGDRNVELRDCILKGDAFKFTGATDGRFIAMRGCDIYGGTPDFGSTNNVGKTKLVKFERSMCSSDLKLAGDWSVLGYLCEMYGNGVITIDTTGSIAFNKILLPNGIHFVTNPAGSKSIVGCDYINSGIAADHLDVSADVTITDVAYSGNDQQNGISGKIRINNPEKNVGVGAHDRYFSLQHAITSIPENGCGIIKIWEDLVNLPEMTLPNANTTITINCQETYGMAFTGDIVEITANRCLLFHGSPRLTGNTVEINGDNAKFCMKNCLRNNVLQILATSGVGALVYLRNSTIAGSTGNSPLQINSTGPTCRISYSKLTGATGQPAIEFTVDADGKLQTKFSTFVHGDKGANAPLVNTAVGQVDIAVYACGLNATWDANKFTNLIGNANNTTDAEIDF